MMCAIVLVSVLCNITDSPISYVIFLIVCSLSCSSGYIANNDCTQCVLNDICAVSNPCQNGGTCTLFSSPDNYTCNCIDMFTQEITVQVCLRLKCHTPLSYLHNH